MAAELATEQSHRPGSFITAFLDALDAVDGGVISVQLREETAPARQQVELLEALSAALPAHMTLLVNDRVDVYLAARHRGARVHGVHMGQSDLDAVDVRRLLGPEAVLGLSAATPDQLGAAETSTANVTYVGIGTLRTTFSKADAPAPIGAERLG
ncbi:hypothetical protein GCM10010977_24200 [Citricoccus zhacaiensis]|uniref:Thiamine phosphate synthase/TenI domain-containing protein n=1 Tax=Citricoccus zhacaiensis TaxID=489142 RepID=A0ABQ2M667_9MICC|nr:thiamine phosphate synthase [Citricoccus zhacaiensis]GGO47297.1 hypothetical protein GCM10010977_24200 [Citricoccus zhacaiensis]